MAKLKFYLDKRGGKDLSPLKIRIAAKDSMALIPTNVSLYHTQWDDELNKIINHPNAKQLNNIIQNKFIQIETLLLRMFNDGKLKGLSASKIKDKILKELSPTDETQHEGLFLQRFNQFTERKSKQNTKRLYLATLTAMRKFDRNIEDLSFDDITQDWLRRFDCFLTKTSPSANARNIHFRNIRAVFNDAIDDDITTAYPFRKFKLRYTPTIKRSLNIDEIRCLFSMTVEPHIEKYRDMFKLMFFLIGINPVDIFQLTKKNINQGRLIYTRAKTQKQYSIKIEPEASEILSKYSNGNHLIDIMDKYSSYRNLIARINNALQRIGDIERGKHGAKIITPKFPDITAYWARHTWATIAAELDIPKETIAASLGHGGNTVTDIYIRFDAKKIDEANRRVIDYVLYNKQ